MASVEVEVERKFIRGQLKKYTLEEKHGLGELCKKYRDEYDAEITETSKKANYNYKVGHVAVAL